MPDSSTIQPAGDASCILAVIVLYRTRLSDSRTFMSLRASCNVLNRKASNLKVLLFDNTPDTEHPGSLPLNVFYEAPGKNAGLAAAYNCALDTAREMGASWLLLLDQDSVLPPDFFELLKSKMEEHKANADVVAIVPVVRSRGVTISPRRIGFFGTKPLSKSLFGIQDAEITSINSGTAVRCDFVRSIGGFNRAYWLDYLDHWLFRRIYEEGKRAVVFDCTLEHHLSVANYRRNIDIGRYHSILCGESAFTTTYKPKAQIPFYLLRLLVRAARMTLRGQSDLALLTMRVAAKIMLHPNRSLEGAFGEGTVANGK